MYEYVPPIQLWDRVIFGRNILTKIATKIVVFSIFFLFSQDYILIFSKQHHYLGILSDPSTGNVLFRQDIVQQLISMSIRVMNTQGSTRFTGTS